MAEDKNLACRDCGKTYVFTSGEQAFYSERGLSDPIRCPECRRIRKQQRALSTAGPLPSTPPGDRGGVPSVPRNPGGFDRDRDGGPSRPTLSPPRVSKDSSDDTEEPRFTKNKPKASAARFTVPKKEGNTVAKEKRPGNRRDEEKLLLNWKEEVGLDDEIADNGDWLAHGEDEEEE